MAAEIVDGSLLAGHWKEHKPDDYKGDKGLESALKAYEKLATKVVKPINPSSGKGLDPVSIEDLSFLAGAMRKAADDTDLVIEHYTSLKEAALKASKAASETSGDLRKQAREKQGDEKKRYEEAAEIASAISTDVKATILAVK